MPLPQLRQERGFSLMELLIASVVMLLVVGGAVALTGQIQTGYRRQIEDSAAEQEARYALELIGRSLRSAGSSPRTVPASVCTPTNPIPTFAGVVRNPNGDADNDDIVIQTDSNPPDGVVGGTTGACTQANEQVRISFCSPADVVAATCTTANTIEFLDEVVGGAATTRTDSVIQNLQFEYLQADGSTPAAVGPPADLIFFVRVTITVRTRTVNPTTGLPDTRVLQSVTRVRAR
jgi:prepilin-type N-terminal cleavage/methylation domain-containing protein